MSDNKKNSTGQSSSKILIQDSWEGAKSILKSSQSSSQQPKTSEKKN
ncbi:hypothetical protein ACPV5G_00830 [Photobacterium damselae]